MNIKLINLGNPPRQRPCFQKKSQLEIKQHFLSIKIAVRQIIARASFQPVLTVFTVGHPFSPRVPLGILSARTYHPKQCKIRCNIPSKSMQNSTNIHATFRQNLCKILSKSIQKSVKIYATFCQNRYKFPSTSMQNSSKSMQHSVKIDAKFR